MTISDERKAANQATFRFANEKLEANATPLDDDEGQRLFPFLCECMRPTCTEAVLLRLSEYERGRSDARYSLIVPGHEDLTVEHVLETNERFGLTEKFGLAGQLYENADPRS